MAENLKISLKKDTPEVKVQANVPTIIDGSINGQAKINFVSVGQRGSVGPAGPAGTITAEQQAAINANTAKTGITTEQANAITVNTSKNSYPSSDSTKLAGIESGAEVNVQANWNETDSNSDAFIQNKPTIPTDTNTTYSVSCVDGENSDEEKIRLTDSNGSTDDIVLEAGTGLSIARSGDKITFTNTVTDTDTVLTAEQVQDVVGAMFTSNTETRVSATYDDSDGTIDLVVDDMTADTNTQLTDEQVQDIVGAMVDGGTETNISVTYDDTSGKLNFVSTDTNTTYSSMGSGNSYAAGLTPAGSGTHGDTYLRKDGTWATPTDTNTTYSEATSSDAGLMSTTHHDKLDGIEASADVTDTTNVTAAGALMDSELTDLAGVKSLDTSTLVTLAGTQSITGGKTFTKPLILDGDKSVTASSDGVTLHIDSQDITDSSTSGSGTATAFNHITIENPRLFATNSSVTTTNASTVYIKGAPVASTNQTITNAHSLYVAAGHSYFGGDLTVNGSVTGDVTGNVSGSSGSCTGNAATATTATALTVGDKTISGTLKVSGNDILDEDDVVCIRFDSSGNTKVFNGLTATLKNHKHFINFGVNLGYNYARWLPWGSYYIVEQTTDANPEYTTYVAPYDGKFIKLVIRSEESLADTAISIYKVGDGTEEPDQGSLVDTKTVDIASANTAYEYTFDSDATFSKGDAMSVKIQPTTDPVAAGVTGTFVLQFDLTT